MPMCPQCNVSVPATAGRCFQCGVSLTQRIANAVPTGLANGKRSQDSFVRMWRYAAVLFAVIILIAVGVWSFSSTQVIEVENGISILLPKEWKKVRATKVGVMNAYAYRGELSEKVELTMMIQLQIPQEARNKARQIEGLNAMFDSVVSKDDPLPRVIDLSRNDVIHLQATADDKRILDTASAQLALDDFKHLRLGTIIRNGDYIHYGIAFDEKNDVFRSVMQTVEDLVRSP